MNKQMYLYCGIWLSLFNIISFSMQPGQEGNFYQQECPELSCKDPSINEQLSQTFIAHFPEASKIVKAILAMERNRAVHRDTNEYRLESHLSHKYLLIGPEEITKNHIARAMGRLLKRKKNIVDFSQINLEELDTRPTIEEKLAPILRKKNKPRVVILENIERLSTKVDDNDYDEEKNPILRLRPFIKEIEQQERDKFVLLATTNDHHKIPYSLRSLFLIIEILKGFIEKLDIPIEIRESSQLIDSAQLPEEKQENSNYIPDSTQPLEKLAAFSEEDHPSPEKNPDTTKDNTQDIIEKLDTPVEIKEYTQPIDSTQLIEEKKESPICTVPKYILWRILTYLPISDVVPFLSTCQYLNRQPVDPNFLILLRGKIAKIKKKIEAIENQGKFIRNKYIIFIRNSHNLEEAHEFFSHFLQSNKRAEKISLLKTLPYFKSEFCEDVGQLLCLQELSLEETAVNTATIAKLCCHKNIQQSLKILYLSTNGFGILPEKIGKLTSLEELNLTENRLRKLPRKIGQLTNLQMLKLAENMLNVLPPEIDQLTNLTNLDLSVNNFKSLPKEISYLSKLQILNLSYNKHMNPYPEIGELPNLQILNLSNTLFSPEAISTLCTYPNIQQNLKKLGLSDNELTKLPSEIVTLDKLQVLHLSHNQLMKLPKEIENLRNLQILTLGDNQLTELPPKIGQLTNLQKLIISENKLLPEAKTNLRQLLPKTKII